MIRLFVEQLTVLDFAYLDPQRGLIGDSWVVDVELGGELDDQSMVLDFGDVKRSLKQQIDGIADHKLIVPRQHAGLKIQELGGTSMMLFQGPEDGPIEHQGPANAICLIDAAAINRETLTAHLEAALRPQLPNNIREISLQLRHEAVEGAYYHYAHGLKKHLGHCQRIAHGHRSRVEIRVNGGRRFDLEQLWAERWRDIYLGTQEDVVQDTEERIRFEYSSVDGDFALELPASRCELLNGDTTVERLAAHIAQAVRREVTGPVEVRAYEGLLKGAIARLD